MVVGNMGTQKKMNYTIISNAVNLASRLEGVNKQYGTWILASESTIRETEGKILTRPLDMIRVVGINEPVRIYEVMDIAAEAETSLKEQVELFHRAHTLFEERNWKNAEKLFNLLLSLVPGDPPSMLYLDRCRLYRDNPPQKDWDGVFNLTEK
jgi:adenylate cyclase